MKCNSNYPNIKNIMIIEINLFMQAILVYKFYGIKKKTFKSGYVAIIGQTKRGQVNTDK